jgi:hypothetical protein
MERIRHVLEGIQGSAAVLCRSLVHAGFGSPFPVQ